MRDGPLRDAGEREQAGASWAGVWAGAEPCWAGSRDTGPGELPGPREELGRCAPGGPRGELVGCRQGERESGPQGEVGWAWVFLLGWVLFYFFLLSIFLFQTSLKLIEFKFKP